MVLYCFINGVTFLAIGVVYIRPIKIQKSHPFLKFLKNEVVGFYQQFFVPETLGKLQIKKC